MVEGSPAPFSHPKRVSHSKGYKIYLQNLRRRDALIFGCRVLILILFFLLWELAAKHGLINAFITSRPSRIWATTLQMIEEGQLLYHLSWTIGETIAGFTVGTLSGILIAVILWWSDFISRVLDPYIVVLNSIPKVALGPIFILWLGTNVFAVVAMAVSISVVVTIMMVHTGFKEVDKNKVKLLRTFGADKIMILRKVILPASVPTMLAALKVSVGLSLVGTIVGEFLASKAGLGYLIIYGGQIFNMSLVMASIILLSILSILLYSLVSIFERKVVKKREE